MKIECKYPDCGFHGQVKPYVGFFPSERITQANRENPIMPKYGFHIGVDCIACGRWQRWLPQTDENMLGIKFYNQEQAKLL